MNYIKSLLSSNALPARIILNSTGGMSLKSKRLCNSESYTQLTLQGVKERGYDFINNESSLNPYQMKRLKYTPVNRQGDLLKFFSDNKQRGLLDKWRRATRNVVVNEQRLIVKLNKQEIHINYSLWENAMYISFCSKITTRFYMVKQAIRNFDSDILVIDCGFEYETDKKSYGSLITQLILLNGVNRVSDFPFNICFRNLQTDSKLYFGLSNGFQCVERQITLDQMFDVSEKSYIDTFDVDKLVYLSPASRNVLKTVKANKIYIIGGLVDQGADLPYSLSKAKCENIITAKLPLDRYLDFKANKSLSLHVVGKILINYVCESNWDSAVKCIPSRLVYNKQNRYQDEYEFPNV